MGIINITATDAYVALKPNDLLKSPIKFGWTHAAGVLEVTLPHDLANTIRALVMMANHYQQTFPPWKQNRLLGIHTTRILVIWTTRPHLTSKELLH